LQYPLLEVHLLDYNGNLYGSYLKIEFKAHLRDECHFGDLNALKEAISQDVDHARQWFKTEN